MKPFALTRILAAIDLSPTSLLLLSWADLFARKFDSQVEVFHAQWLDLPPYFTDSQIDDLTRQLNRNRSRAEQAIWRLVDALPSREGYTVQVRDGHAVESLGRRLQEEQFDMIVLGSHGRSGVSRLLMGSVSENVVRMSDCPVLVVRSGAAAQAGGPRLTHLLCPVNFTEHSQASFDLCSQLAERFGARLSVLHAVEDRTSLEAGHQRLCEWVPGDARSRCQISEIVRQGEASVQVIEAARELGVDLILIGAEHRPFLEFTTLGTTTERVMRHSGCSVLVTPTRMYAG